MNDHGRGSVELRGHWLTGARLVWLLVAALTLTLYVLAVPARFQELQAICTGAACYGTQLTPDDIRTLQSWGLSRFAHAVYSLTFEIIFALFHFLVALIIFVRRSNDRMALLVSLMLITFGPATFTGTMNALTFSDTGWQLPVSVLSSLPNTPPDWVAQPLPVFRPLVAMVYTIGQVTMALFFFLFPDGRLTPRWGILPMTAWVAWQVPPAFFPDSPLDRARIDLPVTIVAWGAFLGLFLFAQVYRYRVVSNYVQRQQTKWVVFGVSLGVGGFLTATLIASIFSYLEMSNLLLRQAVLTLIYLSMILIPLSIGFAMLRSHLWDIDILIRRTLVYSTLTAIMAAFNFAAIFVLQALFRAVTGQGQSEAAVAITTLAIALLFSPLRLRIQQVIDRRFYRSKYNTAQVLAAFGGIVRNEVDLDRLTEHLIDVVQETMQPAHVSLWLRDRKEISGSR